MIPYFLIGRVYPENRVFFLNGARSKLGDHVVQPFADFTYLRSTDVFDAQTFVQQPVRELLLGMYFFHESPLIQAHGPGASHFVGLGLLEESAVTMGDKNRSA